MRGLLTTDLTCKIDEFLSKAKRKDFWRANELHEELVGPGDDRLLEMKGILEQGVDDGRYERLIAEKKKVFKVGYRLKLDDGVPEEAALQTTGEKGWERKKK